MDQSAQLSPPLEQHVQSLVHYCRICDQQAAVMRLDPDEQFAEHEKERSKPQTQVRANPVAIVTYEDQLAALSEICDKLPADSMNARVRISNAAATCIAIIHQHVLTTLPECDKLAIIGRTSFILSEEAKQQPESRLKAPRDYRNDPMASYARLVELQEREAAKRNGTMQHPIAPLNTKRGLSHTKNTRALRPILSCSSANDFWTPAQRRSSTFQDYGTKKRAGEVYDVLVSGFGAAYEITMSRAELLDMLDEYVALVC
ncbi:hypothetical protein B0H10DRAFT_1950492 [Mycena sp. CBHHK59/15]|nr:hypothetical protein B0H10DRAFT_1950492 [Mycena sp. CBHHK59/15]